MPSPSSMTASVVLCAVFFFQAEDGIRDVAVTGVQTCALPICESFEFLVGGELLAHLRNKRRTNELGGALAAVRVTQLVEGAMFLGVHGIHALATRLLTGRVLLG